MPYTIFSARYANAEQSAAVISTQEAGDVLLSSRDTPDDWAHMLKWGEPSAYVAPPPPPPAPISDRQFAHGLWKRGIITKDEALAFVKVGQVPAALETLVSALPADQRDDAELLITGSVTFAVDHPLVQTLGAAFGWSQAQLFDFWRFAATL